MERKQLSPNEGETNRNRSREDRAITAKDGEKNKTLNETKRTVKEGEKNRTLSAKDGKKSKALTKTKRARKHHQNRRQENNKMNASRITTMNMEKATSNNKALHDQDETRTKETIQAIEMQGLQEQIKIYETFMQVQNINTSKFKIESTMERMRPKEENQELEMYALQQKIEIYKTIIEVRNYINQRNNQKRQKRNRKGTKKIKPSSTPAFSALATNAIDNNPIIDSGTTGHFWCLNDTTTTESFLHLDNKTPIFEVKPTTNPISVKVSNGQNITSTHEGKLRINLPPEAQKVHLFPDLATSLISVGQLCDHDCTATFDKNKVLITHGDKIVLQGKRNTANGLWHITPTDNDIQTHVSQVAHWALSQETAADRIAFLHACAGYPAISTWTKAVEKGHYHTWPGLTVEAIRKNPPRYSVPMIKVTWTNNAKTSEVRK